MKKFVFVLLALMMSMQVVFANSNIREGYMISGHVIEKDTEENIEYAPRLAFRRRSATKRRSVYRYRQAG